MMFINSIFLPKTISDQTIPEGSFGKTGSFSHLFSNVFRIVKDDQGSAPPFQLANLDPDSVKNIPNELLKVSLFSDNQFTLENTNISMIVSAFLAKIKPGENGNESADISEVKVNEKISKYFSLSKNEFLKEIENIIKALKNGDAKSFGNVEISLTSNGQSVNINPLTTNIVELENWANEQLQSNSNFEILVKSGQQKLSVDVEPVKMETPKKFKPVEIISINIDDNIESGSKSVVDKNQTKTIPILNNSTELVSASNELLESSKQIFTTVDEQTVNEQTVKQETSQIQELESSSLRTNSKIISDKITFNNKSVIDKAKVYSKTDAQNIPAAESDLKKEFIPGIENGIILSTETLPAKENILTDIVSLNLKNLMAEKQVNTSANIISIESKVNPDVLKSGKVIKNARMFKQTSDLKIKEFSNSDKKINVKANQEINSASINKNTAQNKIALNNFIEKANVKEINITIRKFVKINLTNAQKFQNENKSDIISIKQNSFSKQLPAVNAEVKKGISTNQEIKQPTVKKTLGAEKFKSEKTFISVVDQKPTITKHELNNKFVGTDKVQNVPRFRGKQELYVGNKLMDKEQGAFTKIEKSVLPKIDSVKIAVDNQQTVKESSKIEQREKLEVESKNLEQTKTSPVYSLKPKTGINVNETSKKSLKPQIKTDQRNVITSNKEYENTESNSSNNLGMSLKNVKERSVFENLNTSLKENVNDKSNSEIVAKNQFENKIVKVDLMQRRIFSQIPPLEILTDDTEVKNIKNPELNFDNNKDEKVRSIDEQIKSSLNGMESKPKNEKHVWVKVSLEKNDNEVASEIKKLTPLQSKITIDQNNDGLKEDFEQDNFSEKESHESKNIKTQNISVETNQYTEQKPAVQNQTANNQQDLLTNIKPEIRTGHNSFKSALHSEESVFNSRASEMVEKIKVISSGEMIREVYKVFESGEKQSIVLRLVPKELGAIKIMLDTIDNVLTAKVEVQNESVGHIIQNNVDQLKQNLLQSGVHVNTINISYHNPDHKQNGFQNHKRKNPTYLPGNEIEEVDETILSKKMGYNTYEYLA